jgi:hypothetical protein
VFLISNKNRIPKEDVTQIQDSKQYKHSAENSAPETITTDEIYVYRNTQK